jgi:hypothetical protein
MQLPFSVRHNSNLPLQLTGKLSETAEGRRRPLKAAAAAFLAVKCKAGSASLTAEQNVQIPLLNLSASAIRGAIRQIITSKVSFWVKLGFIILAMHAWTKQMICTSYKAK